MDLSSISQIANQIIANTSINTLQFYGFLFLLGSFTVASLSDIKRMAAQREFAEVWLIFSLVVFAYDYLRLSEFPFSVFAIKWILIVVFSLLSWRFFGLLLSLAEMDLTAACAAMALLNPIMIVIYYLLLVMLNFLLKPILKKFGDGVSVPFMPVILLSTVLIAAFAKLIPLL